jgi:hypothetical protein
MLGTPQPSEPIERVRECPEEIPQRRGLCGTVVLEKAKELWPTREK